MKRCFRRLMMFLSICAMLHLSISSRAEEPLQASTTGNGQIEGIVQPYVYQVVLPTYVDGCFDFIMDPQRLIEETNGAAYNGSSFEKGATVFFKRTDGRAEEDYSSSSDHMVVMNRSNVPIEVSVSVSISKESLGGISMTGDRTFAADTGASLYMALTDGENTVPVEESGACIQVTLPAAPEEAFEYVYDQESGNYAYGLKEDLSGIPFPEYSFWLTGAVNESEDWALIGKASLQISTTWKVVPGEKIGENITWNEEKAPNQVTEPGQTEDSVRDMEPEPEGNEIQEGEAFQGTDDLEQITDSGQDVTSEPEDEVQEGDAVPEIDAGSGSGEALKGEDSGSGDTESEEDIEADAAEGN